MITMLFMLTLKVQKCCQHLFGFARWKALPLKLVDDLVLARNVFAPSAHMRLNHLQFGFGGHALSLFRTATHGNGLERPAPNTPLGAMRKGREGSFAYLVIERSPNPLGMLRDGLPIAPHDKRANCRKVRLVAAV